VLARLLALNAERYGEEQAMGLQGKGGKVVAMATDVGNMRGKEGKPPQAPDSYQMGLAL
jgi:hypothetical protein